jgi:hypothetical protein
MLREPSRGRRISVAEGQEFPSRAFCSSRNPESGATDIPRKPNYDLERRERERTKAAESAKKAQAKADKRAAEQGLPAADGANGS